MRRIRINNNKSCPNSPVATEWEENGSKKRKATALMEKKYWTRRKDEDLLSRLVPFSLLGRLCRREKRSCSMDKMEIASILIE